MEESNESAIYEFEEFRLDTRRRELTAPAEQRRVPLKPKEYEALLFFVTHAGQLLDKETLMTGIWPGLVVEENNLNQQVTALRHLLGEAGGTRRFLMNVRGKGYKFVPEVVRLDEALRWMTSVRAAPTRDRAAWQCYQHAILLTGMENPSQWSAAVEVLSRAVALDPHFASAWAHLAQTHLRLMASDWPGYPDAIDRSERAARQAISLRPDLAVAQMAAGSVAAARGDWVAGEKNFRTAKALDEDWPLIGDIHSAYVLLSTGHLRRAVASARVSQAHGHGMVGIVLIHALTHLLNDNDAEALEAVTLMTALGAQAHRPHVAGILARLAQRAHKPDEAARLLQASLADSVRIAGGERIVSLATAASEQRGSTSAAVEAIDQLVSRVGLTGMTQAFQHQILAWYAELGEVGKAYRFADEMLDHLSRRGTVGVTWSGLWLREISEFRRDRRFAALAARIGFTEYWNTFGPPDGSITNTKSSSVRT